MRISQLAERSGVPASTLRYYEQRGLLPARRSGGGYRLYDHHALDRLAFIVTNKRLGLDLDEIAELLGVWQDGACAQVKASLRPRIVERITAADAHAGQLSAFTTMLRGALEHLDALPDRPGRCDPNCGFLNLAAPRSPRPQLPMIQPATSTPAIACSLDAADRQERIGQWRAVLRGARREEIPGGLRISFSADRAGEAAGLAAAEQRCCAFFSFTLHFDHDTAHLDVRAPEEARQMVSDLVGQSDHTHEPGRTAAC